MTWEIVAGLIALGGFVIAVGTVIVKINSTLVKLDTTMKQLIQFTDKQNKKNEGVQNTLQNHEGRIQRVEDKLDIKK